MEATVNMDSSTHASAGRQPDVLEIEESERDMVDRNLWAHSSTSADCCCQTKLADN